MMSSDTSERVLVLAFSEFGRRLDENGSGGTDHGTAAPVFLLGQPVNAGLHGPYPDLTHLEDGDPTHAIDFRRIYATLLDRWLGVPHRDILGAAFEPHGAGLAAADDERHALHGVARAHFRPGRVNLNENGVPARLPFGHGRLTANRLHQLVVHRHAPLPCPGESAEGARQP